MVILPTTATTWTRSVIRVFLGNAHSFWVANRHLSVLDVGWGGEES